MKLKCEFVFLNLRKDFIIKLYLLDNDIVWYWKIIIFRFNIMIFDSL